MSPLEIAVIVICSLIVVSVIGGGIIRKIRNKKSGKIGCSSCSGCPYCSSCNRQTEKGDK